VLSGEHSALMSVHACPAPKRAGYRRRVLERWGHSSVQCNSSCRRGAVPVAGLVRVKAHGSRGPRLPFGDCSGPDRHF
jgi:hypothetical protein